MIRLTLLALALVSAPGWNSDLWRIGLAVGWGDIPRTAVAARAWEIGDSPEPIPPKR